VDVQRFIQVFGGIVLHSTPHLYVSALPFLPANSPLSRHFSARFPNTLNVASGRDINWPAVQTVLRGHTDSITSVSFSPDNSRIVTCSWDETVRLWDAATGQPIGEPLRGHTNSVLSVAFSPDGTRIVTGSSDKTVRLWDAATGQPVGEPLRGHTNSITSVSFSPDGTRIVTGSRDKTVRMWDAGTGQPVGEPLRGHTDSVTSVSFSPDGARIVTGSSDQTVRLWDAGTGQPVGGPLRGHTSLISSVSFSSDDTRIVTGSWDHTVRLWDAVMRQPSQQYAESDHPVFSDEQPTIEATTTMTSNSQNNHFNSFSSNSLHALCTTSELTEGTSPNDRGSTPFVLNVDSGWVVGPRRRLLFWVPPASRHSLKSAELDLSRMAHGQLWQKCREK
jgi:WD40 repeat protein